MARMLGDLLRAYRKALGWKQSDLAKATGLTRGYIGMLEQGRRGPDAEQLELLVKALEIADSPKERQRLIEAGNAARADQDKDLAEPMKALRDEIRKNRQMRREVVEMLLRLRDTVLKAGVKLPDDLLEAIERVARLP